MFDLPALPTTGMLICHNSYACTELLLTALPTLSLLKSLLNSNIGLPDAPNPTPDPNHTRIAHNDCVSKTKVKLYADNHRHTQMSSLQPGDPVLVKQHKFSKPTPPFNPKLYTVVKKYGSMVTAQHAKMFVTHNSSHIRHIKVIRERKKRRSSFNHCHQSKSLNHCQDLWSQPCQDLQLLPC